MAKPFPVQVFRSDVSRYAFETRSFKRWAIYLEGEHVADINATAAPGYAPRVSITNSRGRVLVCRVSRRKAAR